MQGVCGNCKRTIRSSLRRLRCPRCKAVAVLQDDGSSSGTGILMHLNDVSEKAEIHLPEIKKSRSLLVVAPNEKPQSELAITYRHMDAYAKRCNADLIIVRNMPSSNHPCAYKFVLGRVAEHYDQTLMVDTDVVIKDSCPDIFEQVPVGKWGMTDDLPRIKDRNVRWMLKEWDMVCEALGEKLGLLSIWNSGLCVAPRNAKIEYKIPDILVPDVWCIEQHILTYNLTKNPERVVTLPDAWQAGYVWRDFQESCKTSHTVHANGCWHHPTRLRILAHFSRNQNSPVPEYIVERIPEKHFPIWADRSLVNSKQIRIAKKVLEGQRILDWAKFFRHEGEVGLGDTLSRLKEESKGKRELRRLISSAISECACNETESIRRLNEQHKYQQPMHQ